MVRKTVTTYEVRGYSKKSNEYDKKVSVSNWEVNFEVDNSRVESFSARLNCSSMTMICSD